MTGFENQARLFKALMHPARLAILDVLRDGEQCVCHLEYVLGYRQAYISQQLSVLRETGLVQDRREGLNIFYRVARPEIFALIDQASLITGSPLEQRPIRHPRKPHQAKCPCPKCSQVLEVAQE
jgi:DNA-binding transcriptional ArsR family regulator